MSLHHGENDSFSTISPSKQFIRNTNDYDYGFQYNINIIILLI